MKKNRQIIVTLRESIEIGDDVEKIIECDAINGPSPNMPDTYTLIIDGVSYYIPRQNFLGSHPNNKYNEKTSS